MEQKKWQKLLYENKLIEGGKIYSEKDIRSVYYEWADKGIALKDLASELNDPQLKKIAANVDKQRDILYKYLNKKYPKWD